MTSWTRAVSILLFILCVAPLAASDKEQTTKDPVVPVFTLRGQLTESPMPEDFPFATSAPESLQQLLSRMKKARDDDAVKAVVLLLDNPMIGRGQTEEIRQVIDQLKEAGKPVYAHASSLRTSSYTLLSNASHVSVVPTGDLWITGIYGESLYLRGLLDKLGVTPDFVTCGAYKSAAETFMRKGPSPEAQEMLNWLLDGLFETEVNSIASGRNVPAERVRGWIDGGLYSAESAKKAGIIDACQFRHDFVAELKDKFGDGVKFDKRYGKKKPLDVDMSNPFGVFALWAQLLQGPSKRKSTRDAVAIVYVDGPIVPGSAQDGLFGTSGVAYSDPIRKALDKVADDETVKAVVLRVNSPGGSAVASEIILDATRRVKAQKPFVVSMGDVAGSGGYYVACASDVIFADTATITGSIGVLGGKFATTDMWNKTGIAWRSNRRGARSGMLSSESVFTEDERQAFQKWMHEIYGVFKGHVVAVRGDRLTKKIDEIAGGRVYTGRQAKELGLIDRIGGLDDAIQFVAGEAKLKDFEVRIVPRPKNFMEALMGDLSESKDDDRVAISAPGSIRPVPGSILELALPLLNGVDGERFRAVVRTLQKLDLLQRERVLLLMPEFLFRQ